MQPRPMAEIQGPPRPNLRCFMTQLYSRPRKLQIPNGKRNPKIQIPNPKQTPKLQISKERGPFLRSAPWIFKILCDLELGIWDFRPLQRSARFVRSRCAARILPNAHGLRRTPFCRVARLPAIARSRANAPASLSQQSRCELPARSK